MRKALLAICAVFVLASFANIENNNNTTSMDNNTNVKKTNVIYNVISKQDMSSVRLKGKSRWPRSIEM